MGRLGAEAVILKPAHPAALLAVLAESQETADRAREAGILKELLRLSCLSGDVDKALQIAANRLSLVYRVAECVIVGAVGDKQVVVSSEGLVDDSPDNPLWDLCRVALEAGVPVLTSEANQSVGTFIATHIESHGGTSLGVVMLRDARAHPFPKYQVESLRDFGQRLYAELAWRAVHDRIAADRDRLRESSLLDPMLGIWTRSALDQQLPAEVSGCIRRKEPMTMAMLDIRGLRHLNERHGHLAGDAALRLVASIVRQEVRAQDMVARYAGHALALAMSATPLHTGILVVERLQQAIAATYLVHEGKRIPLEVVAGIAEFLGEGDTGDAALSRAAGAMKLAKRRREPIAVFEGGTPGQGAEAEEGAHHGLESGATLGGMYQVIHEISRGAMGVVYRAEDLGLGRPVALKTLRPDLARDQSFVERFRSEAATLAALHHENLVQVYAFGVDGDDVYFVMELVEGEPLEDRIEQARFDEKFVPLDLVERVTQQTASALDTMHRAGILHRDVKPSNILLDRVRDRAVLVDVGIAKRRGGEADPAGTPGFTAPEVFQAGREEAPADVYSLGATAYMLLTGRTPFGEDDFEAILERQVAGNPLAPTQIRPHLPREVDSVVLKSLDPDPRNRFRGALQFADALVQAFETADKAVRLGADVASVKVGPAAGTPTSGPRVEVQGAATPEEAGVVEVVEATHTSRFHKGPATLGIPSLKEIAAAAREPQTRGILFRSAYRVLGGRRAGSWLARVCREDPTLSNALQQQKPILAWHPTSAFVRFLEAMAAEGEDAEAFARSLGRVATASTFHSFFGADPRAVSPVRVFQAADHFWQRYHSWGTVKVNARGERAVDVVVTGGPKSPLVCATVCGQLEQVAVLAGAGDVSVSHPACETQGSDGCLFSVRWGTVKVEP